MPVWWNWQTRRTQNPVVAIPCGFDPHYRHQIKKRTPTGVLFYLVQDICSARCVGILRSHTASTSVNPVPFPPETDHKLSPFSSQAIIVCNDFLYKKRTVLLPMPLAVAGKRTAPHPSPLPAGIRNTPVWSQGVFLKKLKMENFQPEFGYFLTNICWLGLSSPAKHRPEGLAMKICGKVDDDAILFLFYLWSQHLKHRRNC